MTEKSPLRTCDDIDEVVLNYAEIKGLAMNNPFIKEKMQVDTEINKLTLLKSSWQESKEKLKNIIKNTPTKIERLSNSVEKIKEDIETYRVNKPIDFKITLNEKSFLDRTKAGEYLNTLIKNIAKEKPTDDIEEIGSFSGFKVGFTYTMGVSKIYLMGEKTYSKDLGVSDIGNITRLENLADDIVKELELYKERLKESEQKLIQAKEEVGKPFEQEERLSYLYKRKIEIDYNVENGIITEVKEDDNVIEETTNFYDFKNMSVAEIKETFKKGMLIKLENMQGENLPSGLLGAVERVDDIGQVKVIWQNGSTLSLNVKENSFEIISNENTKENEYTQNEEIYEEEMWEEIQ